MKNTIINGDCLEVMRDIPTASIDMILCDLPYGVLSRNNKSATWDVVIPFEPLWEQYERIIKDNGAICLFAQGMFTAQLMMSKPSLWRYNLIWDKVNRPTGFLDANRKPLRIHEDICVFYKKQPIYNPQFVEGQVNHKRGGAGNGSNNAKNGCYSDFKHTETVITTQKYPTSIIPCEKEHSKFYHQTQKPVSLCQWLIRTFTNTGDTVLDNTCGSGTTCVAAIREKRNYVGIERDPHYYEVASKRVQQEASQLMIDFEYN